VSKKAAEEGREEVRGDNQQYARSRIRNFLSLMQ
jgi:hypothetical protein